MKKLVFTCALISTAFGYLNAQIQGSLKNFTHVQGVPDQQDTQDNFGYSTGLAGSFCYTATPHDIENKGQLFVHQNSGTNWNLHSSYAPATGDNDFFGYSLDNTSSRLIVGAIGDDDANTDAGAAYVCNLSGGVPGTFTKLIPPSAAVGDQFGRDVAVGGTYAAVSSVASNGNQGKVHIYVQSGGVWSHHQTITSPNPGSNYFFGSSISIDDFGNTLIIGECQALFGNITGNGKVHVYNRLGSTWTYSTTLTDATGSNGDGFGYEVDIAGNTLATSSYRDSYSGYNYAGSVSIFSKNNGVWSLASKVTPNDPSSLDAFGSSLAFSTGSKLVVGAPYKDNGAVVDEGAVYRIEFNGSNWTQVEKLVANFSTDNQLLGFSVAASNNYVVAGAIQFESPGYNIDNYGQNYLWDYNFTPGPKPGPKREQVSTNLIGDQEIQINTYPNPTNDQITIELPDSEMDIQLNIYSTTGQLVYSQTTHNSIERIDLSMVEKGIYLVVANGDFGSITKKVIKE